MPTQSSVTGRAFYGENDQYPPLRRQLVDGARNPINLGVTPNVAIVRIYIAPLSWDYNLSIPSPAKIVDGALCIVEDQAVPASLGYVQWEPGVGDLSPPGDYLFNYKVFWGGSALPQTIPPDTYETLVIKAPVGGMT